ncbi:MAG: response regulator [Chloroflexota bacterium]
MAAISSETVSLIYLLPVLAVVTFFLTDYISGFVIAILLTAVVKTIYPDQVSGITRALLVDAVWLIALIVAAIKLLRPAADYAIHESPTSYEIDELPVSFRHDLLTPVSMILGFCNAILRTTNDGTAISTLYRDNVQGIYRNAQQLEKMISDLLNQLKTVRIPEPEEFDVATLVNETAAMVKELMITHRIMLQIKLDGHLPQLVLNRIVMRQVLLNLLRTLALINDPSEIETHVTIQAHVQYSTLNITFTASSSIIHRIVADMNWSLNERLLEKVGGRLRVEPDSKSADCGILVLALPIPSNITSAKGRSAIVVISEESTVVDFFKEHLAKYEVIWIKDVTRLPAATAPPIAVILTQQQHTSQIQEISDLVGKSTPIIACSIATAEEQLRQLNAVYLPKPVDYDALFKILMSAKLPVKNILIVDDNLDSTEMMAQILFAMSPAFVSRKSRLAREALTLLGQYPIDLIILDVFLPDMDGIELARRIRSHERFAHIPIVFVSAYQSPDFMTPVLGADSISIFQFHGFASDKFATYIKALINAAAG